MTFIMKIKVYFAVPYISSRGKIDGGIPESSQLEFPGKRFLIR